jgi:XTP/dITP diphosphohydrolase
MKILFATSNSHKLDEVRAILGEGGIEVVGLCGAQLQIEEPVEDAKTFAGNARIKAKAYAKATGTMCMADDSGLVVDALDGEPGVYSARYAGIGNTREERDAANNKLLLEKLKGIDASFPAARFVCSLCVSDPNGDIVAEAEGTFDGVITSEPRGSNGFGYDPLLYLPDVELTSAELSTKAKNARSHRHAALQKIIPMIVR